MAQRKLKCFSRWGDKCSKCPSRPRAVSVLDRGRVRSVMIGCKDIRHVITFRKAIDYLEVPGK